MLAMSLFKEAGLPYPTTARERLHQAYLCSMNSSGAIGYGFKDWDHAVIELQGRKTSDKVDPKSVGYLCPGGMKDIGDYKLIWPTKSDPRYKPTDWLERETATNTVYTLGGAQRLVIRTMLTAEPTRPYQHDGNACDHYGRTGVGALANSIGNEGSKSWEYLSTFLATGAAKSSKGLLDGHASTHIHVLWGSLGAALASEKDFREYMEGIRWWFIMAQAHDGGFVVMPGRDYASTDHVYGTRNFPTACAALILSLKEKKLQITGAPRLGVAATAKTGNSAKPASRKLAAGQQRKLNDALLNSLAEISQAKKFQDQPMDLSKANGKVSLETIRSDGKLVFKAPTPDKSMVFEFSELTLADHALLARLAAYLRPNDPEAQALAGVYMEITGQTDAAEKYYTTAGSELRKVCDTWFE
jgi:hypothetical protein